MIDEYKKEPESIIGHIVYCLDSNNDTGLGYVPQTNEKAEYLVYFNTILTNVSGDNVILDDFIHAFSMLHTGSSDGESTVKRNLAKMGITQVDINLLINFWDDLKVESDKTYYELIAGFIGRYLTTRQLRTAAPACYKYTVESKSYDESFFINNKMQNTEFDFIRTQRMVVNYLLAVNYLTVKSYMTQLSHTIPDVA